VRKNLRKDQIEREAEHTLSLPLSFVLEHSGQSVFLSEKTVQSFHFGHFFLFVLLLSPAVCVLPDVMVRLKLSSLSAEL